jgi:hypothetical protein
LSVVAWSGRRRRPATIVSIEAGETVEGDAYVSISTETLSASTLAKPRTDTTISFGSDGGLMSDGRSLSDSTTFPEYSPGYIGVGVGSGCALSSSAGTSKTGGAKA